MKARFVFAMIGIVSQVFLSDPAIIRKDGRNIENLVYGVEPDTDFVPGVKTGGLVEFTNPMDINPEDEFMKSLDLLARCVEAEAGNQGIEGKRLVVDVILNRVKDPSFPDTIQEVIAQPYHFSVYWNGAMDRVKVTEETWKAIELELDQISYPGVLFFSSEGFLPYGTPWKKIGDHYFCTK